MDDGEYGVGYGDVGGGGAEGDAVSSFSSLFPGVFGPSGG